MAFLNFGGASVFSEAQRDGLVVRFRHGECLNRLRWFYLAQAIRAVFFFALFTQLPGSRRVSRTRKLSIIFRGPFRTVFAIMPYYLAATLLAINHGAGLRRLSAYVIPLHHRGSAGPALLCHKDDILYCPSTQMAVAKTYRRRFGSLQDWHFHPKCPDWPEAEYMEQIEDPPPEQLCQRCLRLEQRKS